MLLWLVLAVALAEPAVSLDTLRFRLTVEALPTPEPGPTADDPVCIVDLVAGPDGVEASRHACADPLWDALSDDLASLDAALSSPPAQPTSVIRLAWVFQEDRVLHFATSRVDALALEVAAPWLRVPDEPPQRGYMGLPDDPFGSEPTAAVIPIGAAEATVHTCSFQVGVGYLGTATVTDLGDCPEDQHAAIRARYDGVRRYAPWVVDGVPKTWTDTRTWRWGPGADEPRIPVRDPDDPELRSRWDVEP